MEVCRNEAIGEVLGSVCGGLCWFGLVSPLSSAAEVRVTGAELRRHRAGFVPTGHAALSVAVGSLCKLPRAASAGLLGTYSGFQTIVPCERNTVLLGKHFKPLSSPMGRVVQF